MMKNTTTLTVLACAIAAALSACGGGGGGGDSTAASQSTPTPAPAPTPAPVVNTSATIVTNLPASTYAAGTPKAAAYEALNAERSRCGFGPLAQSAKLDLAAQNHADYLKRAAQDLGLAAVFGPATNTSNAHLENGARPGFTGASVVERAGHAGYAGAVQETIQYQARKATPTGTAQGASDQVQALLAGPYHAWSLLQGAIDAGTGYVVTAPDPSGYFFDVLEIVVGSPSRRQSLARGAVATYPCDGTVNVPFGTEGEFPAPIPGRLLPTGPGLYVMAAEGQTLRTIAWTIAETNTGTATPMNLLASDKDPNGILPPNFVAALPDAALKPSTRYDVRFVGTVDGAAIERQWSFTTGPMYLTGGGFMTATGFQFP